VDKAHGGKSAITVLRALRFWGFAPPDQPHGMVHLNTSREHAAAGPLPRPVQSRRR